MARESYSTSPCVALPNSRLAARLGELREAIDGGAVSTVNTALRELFASVVVDYRAGELAMRAHSGASVSVMYQWIE